MKRFAMGEQGVLSKLEKYSETDDPYHLLARMWYRATEYMF
jgi:hypothetical protein